MTRFHQLYRILSTSHSGTLCKAVELQARSGASQEIDLKGSERVTGEPLEYILCNEGTDVKDFEVSKFTRAGAYTHKIVFDTFDMKIFILI